MTDLDSMGLMNLQILARQTARSFRSRTDYADDSGNDRPSVAILMDRLVDEIQRLEGEVDTLTQAARPWLREYNAQMDRLVGEAPGRGDPTPAEVRKEAGLPII